MQGNYWMIGMSQLYFVNIRIKVEIIGKRTKENCKIGL